jgi:hypothetical protein
VSGGPAKTPTADRQLVFYQGLIVARQTWLMDALQTALKTVNPTIVKEQISRYVPLDVQQILAGSSIRDEHVFPVPAVLENAPRLIGYYRLLLNVPQKTFYSSKSGYGFSSLKNMEQKGSLTSAQRAKLPTLCTAMSSALATLVRGAAPTLTARDISELPLLTLGAQLQGGANNLIGSQAVEAVYQAIVTVVQPHVTSAKDEPLTVTNPAGRAFVIAKTSDPDVTIRELVGTTKQPRVAIEVKGGTDQSNAYNRAGEAEKSHQKANSRSYTQRWTIIGMRNVANVDRLKQGSPTTTQWIEATEVMAQHGPDWLKFAQLLKIELGLP